MTELNSEFGSLPPEHQAVLQLAQDQHDIEVTPLEKLAGGPDRSDPVSGKRAVP